MSSLKSLIDKTAEVSNRYNIDCKDLKLMIENIIYLEPYGFGFFTPKKRIVNSKKENLNSKKSTSVSVGFRECRSSSFQEDLDEIKGVNLFIIRLCKKYIDEMNLINKTIDDIFLELKIALKGYDEDLVSQFPLSEYESEMYEQDRWNILRPIKDLEILKNEILKNIDFHDWVKIEIEKREIQVIKYNSYTFESVQKEIDRIRNILLSAEF
jgi:hypothetical protein